MSTVPQISIDDLTVKLANQAITVLDIRDPRDYAAGHIETAHSITNDNLPEFIKQADKDKPYAVCCYRGISSQSAVLYLKKSGFKEVYSVTGGYYAWVSLSPSS